MMWFHVKFFRDVRWDIDVSRLSCIIDRQYVSETVEKNNGDVLNE